jgi:hypothetical protein
LLQFYTLVELVSFTFGQLFWSDFGSVWGVFRSLI